MTIEAVRYDSMRQAMVTSQLRTTAVSDARLVAAIAKVPREDFVSGDSRAVAYRDTAVALGRGRYLNTAMATARLLNEAYLRADDRVLLIGAATGYAAAILELLVRDVVAVESDPVLVAAARTAFAGSATVTVIEAPLAEGHRAGAPYDVVVVDGAVEAVPPALVDQLEIGGRFTTGLTDRGVTRLAAGRRSEHGFGLADFADSDCVVLPGFARPSVFSF